MLRWAKFAELGVFKSWHHIRILSWLFIILCVIKYFSSPATHLTWHQLFALKYRLQFCEIWGEKEISGYLQRYHPYLLYISVASTSQFPKLFWSSWYFVLCFVKSLISPDWTWRRPWKWSSCHQVRSIQRILLHFFFEDSLLLYVHKECIIKLLNSACFFAWTGWEIIIYFCLDEIETKS